MPKTNIEETLRKIVETVDVTNILTEPLTNSIENLLKLAATSMKSEEASIIVRDGNEGDMKFLWAIGKVADQLIGLQIPAGKGIAGFVMSSGQPMAVADVGQEESFYDAVDKQTGYSTQTILATPLRYNGEIIGVLEFVNRVGEPPFEPFTPFEMDKAALFAEALASLVNAHETAVLTESICDKMLKNDDDISTMRSWVNHLRSATEHKELLELALLIRQLSTRGEAERRLCKEVLEAFLRHSESGAETSFLSY
jgi:signal transduction protein with GAF and PtsI domain